MSLTNNTNIETNTEDTNVTNETALETVNPEGYAQTLSLAEKLSIPTEEIEHEIRETAEADYLESQGDLTNRLRLAIGIVNARLISQLQSGRSTQEYEVYVLAVEEPRKTKNGKLVGEAHVIVATEEGTPTYGKITAWDEETAKLATIEEGTGYSVQLSGSQKGAFFQLGIEPNTRFDTHVDLSGFNALEVLQQLFPTVSVDEAAGNPSTDFTDLRLLHGSVTFGNTFKKKDGTEGGQYRVAGTTVTDFDDIQTVTAFVPASQVRFGTGSQLWFLGNLKVQENYGATLNGSVVHVDLGIPRATTTTSGTVSANTEVEDFSDEFEDFE